MVANNTEQARAKLVQIYEYLKALNEQRNPVTRNIQDQPWIAWLRDLPEHACIRGGRLSDVAEEDFVLKVGRPDLSAVPPPPQQIAEWLQPAWERIDGTVATFPVREEPVVDAAPRSVRFEDDPTRVRLFDEWSRARDGWVEKETPARQALAIFERLYALRARIERETERVELVVGDGLLEWDRTDGNRIKHPVLLQSVELHFEPTVPEFTIAETE